MDGEAADKAGVVERICATCGSREGIHGGPTMYGTTDACPDGSRRAFRALSPPPVVEEAGEIQPNWKAEWEATSGRVIVLSANLSRLLETAESLAGDHSDPSTEALAAIYCAKGALEGAPTPTAGEEEVERTMLVEDLRGFELVLRSEVEQDREDGHHAAADMRERRADEIRQAIRLLALPSTPRGLTIPVELRELSKEATKGPWTPFHSGNTKAIMKGSRPKRNAHRWPEIIAWTGFDGADVPKGENVANLHLIAAAVNFIRQALEQESSPTPWERFRIGEDAFDRAVAAMRRTLSNGFDDETAFRSALIEAGLLEKIPPCPEPAEAGERSFR